MNAVERFLDASRRRDVDSAAAQLAPDVVMLNPATDDPVVGRDAVVTALRSVEEACDEFAHTHLLQAADGQGSLFGLVFEARIGEAVLRGVDILELDGRDQIFRFEVAARPMSALMALGARMSGPPAT